MDVKPYNRNADAEAFIEFINKLKTLGHEFPGNYADASVMIRDALEVIDPDWEPEIDGDGLRAFLANSFGIISVQLNLMGIQESTREEQV